MLPFLYIVLLCVTYVIITIDGINNHEYNHYSEAFFCPENIYSM